MKTSELLPRCVSLRICCACHSIQCEIRCSSLSLAVSQPVSPRFIASHCIRVCGCVFIFVSHCSTIVALHPICRCPDKAKQFDFACFGLMLEIELLPDDSVISAQWHVQFAILSPRTRQTMIVITYGKSQQNFHNFSAQY